MDFNPDTWGTVADWVGGVGTTAAFIAAVVVIAKDAKVRKIAQARKVVYVSEETEFSTYKSVLSGDTSTGSHTRIHRYILKNLSDEPIYRVFFYAHEGKKSGRALDSKDVILPGDEFAYEFEVDEPPLASSGTTPTSVGFATSRGRFIHSATGHLNGIRRATRSDHEGLLGGGVLFRRRCSHESRPYAGPS